MSAPTMAFTPVVTSLVPASGASRAFAGVSVQAGDLLRVVAGSESDMNTPSNFRLATPTNDGAALTWTLVASVEPSTTGLWAPVYMWSAVADSSRTLVVTLNRAGSTGTSIGWGGVLLGFRGSDGADAVVSSNSASGFPSLALTTTQANSAAVMVVGDWSSSSTAGVWTAINGTTPTKDADYGDTSNWGFHVAHVMDVGSAASKTFAMSAPSGQKWTAIAFGMKGAAGGGTPPDNTVVPVASGTLNEGDVLSCTTGTWSGSPTPTFTYQWARAILPDMDALWPSGSGTFWNTIPGATASTYTLTEDDIIGTPDGYYFFCIVTGTNTGGTDSAASNDLGPTAGDGASEPNCYKMTAGGLVPVVGRKMTAGGLFPPL